ncbi:tyrosine-type recombinase/integrase [Gordonia sp. DT30]|uniref:tyrosine-type recombinase/integrase n=1 Tax=Gordonia sp. DT30 TaxID=3416546 RepID=UPI003CE93FC2
MFDSRGLKSVHQCQTRSLRSSNMTGTTYHFRSIPISPGVRRGVIFERESGVIHDDACEWLRALADSGASPNTVRTYGVRVAGYLSWLSCESISWDTTKPSAIARWRNHLAVTPIARGNRPSRPRRPQTVSAWLTAVIEFYIWAEAEGRVQPEVVARLTEERTVRPGAYGNEHGYTRRVAAARLRVQSRTNPRPPKWLSSEDDRRALLALALRPRDRLLLHLLYFTGMRIGEALSLFKEDMHLLPDNAAHNCRVRGPHLHIKHNDSQNGALAKSYRDLPLPPEFALTYHASQDERMQVVHDDRSPNVFVSLHGPTIGRALTYAAVYDMFKRWSDLLGFDIRPHQLRHTRATIWLRGLEGDAIDLDVVRVLLGHRSIETTSKYTHADDEALRKAVLNSTVSRRELQ